MSGVLSSLHHNEINKYLILKWIADYACQNFVDDIIEEILNDVLEAEAELSSITVKQMFVWSTIFYDIKEKYAEAITFLDSLRLEAEKCHCLDLFLRLSLGLKIKDILYHQSISHEEYQEKVYRYFSVKALLPDNQLMQIFSIEVLQGFKTTIVNLRNYFACPEHNFHEDLAGGVASCIGQTLTSSLINVGRLFFKAIQSEQPLNPLDQIVNNEELNHLSIHTSEWIKVLYKHLSGVKSLSTVVVRELLSEVRSYETLIDLTESSHLDPSLEEDEEFTTKCNTPQIKFFLKSHNIKGCIVALKRIDGEF